MRFSHSIGALTVHAKSLSVEFLLLQLPLLLPPPVFWRFQIPARNPTWLMPKKT
jgi:hypothetical protein